MVKEDVDTPEKDGDIFALIRFVQRQRKIKRHHANIVSQADQTGNQGVVAQAIAAVHFLGTRRQLDDF